MKLRDVVDFLLLAAMWGASFLLMRIAVPEFGPFTLMWVRAAVAAVILLPLLALRGELKILFREWKAIVVLGIFAAGLPFVLLATASMHLTAGFTSIVNATTALFTALFAVLWLKDRLEPTRWLGVAIGIVGVATLVWDKLGVRDSGGAAWGVLAGFGGAASYGYAANLTRRYWPTLPSFVSATASRLGAALVLTPLALWKWPAAMPPVPSWAAAVAMGVFSSALGYLLFFRLISRVGGVTAASVTLVVPVFAVAWAAVFLAEAVSLHVALGGAVVLLGTSLSMGLVKLRKLSAALE
ncbi:MAG: EamA family transporter [Archangium gephyra]|uniref:EamA family transporter n=1 Tax=Archangium gephyra TaxID=48 RepID=A0A2W5SKJ3_9BACT|nr:MAG: EamA family transporter [Archangium gephyra]